MMKQKNTKERNRTVSDLDRAQCADKESTVGSMEMHATKTEKWKKRQSQWC